MEIKEIVLCLDGAKLCIQKGAPDDFKALVVKQIDTVIRELEAD